MKLRRRFLAISQQCSGIKTLFLRQMISSTWWYHEVQETEMVNFFALFVACLLTEDSTYSSQNVIMISQCAYTVALPLPAVASYAWHRCGAPNHLTDWSWDMVCQHTDQHRHRPYYESSHKCSWINSFKVCFALLTACSFYCQEPLACLSQTPRCCNNGCGLNEMQAW